MYVERKQQVAIIVVAAIILFTAGYRMAVRHGGQKPDSAGSAPVVTVDDSGSTREITVHVSGAVKSPGVYKFPGQARVQDAVGKAVPLATADVQELNLARPLKDGERIEVPLKSDSVREEKTIPAVKPGSSAGPVRVNINRAGAGELESLPGLGPALAERIINYRKNKGLFSSEEELKNVSGIGEKKYEKIKDRITVN